MIETTMKTGSDVALVTIDLKKERLITLQKLSKKLLKQNLNRADLYIETTIHPAKFRIPARTHTSIVLRIDNGGSFAFEIETDLPNGFLGALNSTDLETLANVPVSDIGTNIICCPSLILSRETGLSVGYMSANGKPKTYRFSQKKPLKGLIDWDKLAKTHSKNTTADKPVLQALIFDTKQDQIVATNGYYLVRIMGPSVDPAHPDITWINSDGTFANGEPGTYPDYTKIINRNPHNIHKFDAKLFDIAIRQMCKVGRDEDPVLPIAGFLKHGLDLYPCPGMINTGKRFQPWVLKQALSLVPIKHVMESYRLVPAKDDLTFADNFLFILSDGTRIMIMVMPSKP